jgi:hypothetical protein
LGEATRTPGECKAWDIERPWVWNMKKFKRNWGTVFKDIKGAIDGQGEILVIKKPRKSRINILALKLQSVFNRFIRFRDCPAVGFARCITCRAPITRHNSNASHFKAGDKKHWATRYDERFCGASCIPCNWTHEGNQIKYEQVLIERYGKGIIDEFHVLNKLFPKPKSELWFEEMIKVYTKKCEELEHG